MKEFDNEKIMHVMAKENGKPGKVSKAIGKIAGFGKKHWKGIVGSGVVVGVGAFVKKRFGPSIGEPPMDFEQDTIENAHIDFGEDFKGHSEEEPFETEVENVKE